jgi:hypothetical protein
MIQVLHSNIPGGCPSDVLQCSKSQLNEIADTRLGNFQNGKRALSSHFEDIAVEKSRRYATDV